MDFFRVAAFVPLVATWLELFQIPALIMTILDCVRHNTITSTILDGSNFIWSDWNHLFMLLLILRYYRLVVHILAYLFWYKAIPLLPNPTVTPQNVHVIIPADDPENKDFVRCVTSVLAHNPGFVTVLTASIDIKHKADAALAHLMPAQVRVVVEPMANERHQFTHVFNDLAKDIDSNKDTIVVLIDDHVWWPSPNFLVNLIAPLEDKKVGGVVTNKRVQRERGNSFADSFLNFIACAYLERHKFETTAANAIDGGIFVVSGRTCAVRASIVLRKDFREGLANEHFFGPLNLDDDNYITRFIIQNGWKIKLQNMGYDTLMVTSLSTISGYNKLRGQLLRWAHSQWRSNATTLFRDRAVWTKQPWSFHTIFITWFFNFALPCDALLLYLWHKSNSEWVTIYHILALLWGSKMVKLIPFFWRHPQDLWLFPAYVFFAYFHSFIKLWSVITCWDHSWSGQNLASTSTALVNNDDNDDNDDDDDANKSASAPNPIDSHQSSTYKAPYTKTESSPRRSSIASLVPTTSVLPKESRSQTPVKTEGFTTFNGPSVSPTLTQSSKSMSISSGSSRMSSIGYCLVSTPFASSTSPLATSNPMLHRYGKQSPDETTNGHSPEGSFTTSPDPLIHFRSSSSSTCVSESILFQASCPNNKLSHTYRTPWGDVSTANPHTTPANVRQSQSQTPSPSSSPPKGDFSTASTKTPLDTFNSFANPISPPLTPPQPITLHPVTRATSSTDFDTSLGTIDEVFDPFPSPSRSPLNQMYRNTDAPPNNEQATVPYNPYPTPHSMQTRRSSSIDHLNGTSPTCHHFHRTYHHNSTPLALSPTPIIHKSDTLNTSITNVSSQDLWFRSEPTGYRSGVTKRRRQRHVYNRDFIRGDDCQRVHADGTMLSAESQRFKGVRSCRTPPTNKVPLSYVVPGRPRF
ncbi:hypothetical protein H2198_008940 [Neophaeococcomyces mojaviensis]|uniref:Uncharacterized protein n=1 Tax=Neophaeococcomyces mojaviensis TaxID=3383035 RepID=A0ACC2ZWI1_9EURO|nr:hypothetical protein H2198_008940 [Knufia sp. JES_112]